MGNDEYRELPRYIAVQVSAERWQVAELIGEPDASSYRPPTYKAHPQKYTQGGCNNRLGFLQNEARRESAEQRQRQAFGTAIS